MKVYEIANKQIKIINKINDLYEQLDKIKNNEILKEAVENEIKRLEYLLMKVSKE